MRNGTVLFWLLVLGGVTSAESITFDFSAGIGPNFSVREDDTGWDVRSDATGLRVSWDSNLRPFPSSAVEAGLGGVDALFTIDGDFSVTVDYTLHQFPSSPFSGVLIDSVLGVGPVVAGVGRQFEVLRFATSSGQFIEGFDTVEGPISPQLNSDSTGRYRITRTGSVISGFFASGGSSSFMFLGSKSSGFDGPIRPFLIGFYVIPANVDPDMFLDISFNNLLIEADRIEGAVPEPSTFALVALAVLMILRCRYATRTA